MSSGRPSLEAHATEMKLSSYALLVVPSIDTTGGGGVLSMVTNNLHWAL